MVGTGETGENRRVAVSFFRPAAETDPAVPPSPTHTQPPPLPYSYIHAGLKLSATEAGRLAASATAAATAARRLHLVLDLDHTLLNSTRVGELPAELGRCVERVLAEEGGGDAGGGAAAAAGDDGDATTTASKLGAEGEATGETAAAGTTATPATTTTPPPRRHHPGIPCLPPTSRRTLFHLPSLGLWTKLRPGCRSFLAAAASQFELSVYTHGDRSYADAMAALLDPGATLFGDRVISGGDSTRAHAKSLDVVLGDAHATLILDDTRAVWPRHADNLIVIPRYVYFPADAVKFAGAVSLLAKDTDECADSGALSMVARVLEAVHTASFAAADADASSVDVRVHLASERRRVLSGCRLVLSGVAPIGTDARSAPAARTALALGATLQDAVDASTTHVVAAADGTAKAVAGRATGAAIVAPAWLDACALAWSHARETDFPPPPPGAPRARDRPSSAADLAAAQAAAGRLGG